MNAPPEVEVSIPREDGTGFIKAHPDVIAHLRATAARYGMTVCEMVDQIHERNPNPDFQVRRVK